MVGMAARAYLLSNGLSQSPLRDVELGMVVCIVQSRRTIDSGEGMEIVRRVMRDSQKS